MSLTAVGVAALDGSGNPVKGVVGVLVVSSLPQAIPFITNKDGWCQVDGVPFPFTGTIQVGGVAQSYDVAIPIEIKDLNVMIRFGGVPAGPHDVMLPAIVPFV